MTASLSLAALLLVLAACSHGSTAASGPTTTGATAETTGATAAPTGAAPAGSTGATPAASAPSTAVVNPTTGVPGSDLVPMQTPQGGEFASPSGNITCEVDYQRAGLTEVYCQTGTPPRSATMSTTGTYTTCTGEQCLGNAGEGTPTLAYGKATGVGPFRCESATTGVTCTASGKGFRISTSGIVAVSS